MITVTINGKGIKLEKPATVLEAARIAGIKIPTLCYYEGLELYGGCRLCLVEVEKMPKLQTACTLYVTDGMVVRTESEEITKARRGVLEFLLINHPLDCPYCDKAGECELQDLVMKYGPTTGRFEEGKRKHPESFDDPIIVRNMERCVVCTRCVRMCDGVQGASAIAVTNRGSHSFIEPFSSGEYNCEYCGNCLAVCPVGAIMSRLHRHAYRPWQVEQEVNTVCSYCGVGCSMVLQVRENTIKRVISKIGLGVNKGLLCARGRFGYEYVGSHERLSSPLVKKNGKLEPATWDEALTTVANRLKEIKERFGGEAIAGIASPRCTNEDNYVFQKLFRAGLGSNNIDSSARLGYAGAQRYLEGILGQGATANIISGIVNSEGVFIVGGDPTHINPILGIQIRAAFRKGVRVITVGYTPGLERFRTAGLLPYPHTEGMLLSGLLEELLKIKSFPGENKAFEAKINEFKRPSAGDIEKVCNITKEEFSLAAKALSDISSVSMVIGRDIIQCTGASTNLFLLAAIAYILNARVYLLSERPNEQGLIDMGCLPDTLPGGRPLEIGSFRKRDEDAWDCQIPSKEGLTLMEIIESANTGSIKAMYVMGENPVYNLPDSNFVKNALENLGFLVVQDIFMTETAAMADVVLPSLSWAEKDGTYTNLERRIQRLRKAINRQGMEDWRILSEVGKKIGLKMPYNSAEDIMTEISMVSPLHTGLTYEDIDRGLDQWPYKGEPLRQGLGVGDWGPVKIQMPGHKGRLYLSIEKPLFHSGTLSRKAQALNNIYPEPVVKVNPETAKKFGLKDDDIVAVTSSKGSLILPVRTDKLISESLALVTNTFKGKGAMSLLSYKLDPITKIPCIDAVEVTIEKVVNI